MSVPARKQPGARARRKKQAIVRRFQQRLLQAASGKTPALTKYVQAMVAAAGGRCAQHRRRQPWPTK